MKIFNMTSILNTFLIELKVLRYVVVEPRLIIAGLCALSSALFIVVASCYIFYLRHGVQPFDASTFQLIQDISLLNGSFTVIGIFIFYVMAVSFFENFFYCMADRVSINNDYYFRAFFITCLKAGSLINLSFFLAIMSVFEENFFVSGIHAVIRSYAATLGLDLSDEKFHQTTAKILLVLPVLAMHDYGVRAAFEESSKMLHDNLAIDGELKPIFSFRAWDFSLFVIVFISLCLHVILSYALNVGATFVLFLITTQLMLSINRFARALFSLLVFKYCSALSVPSSIEQLIRTSYQKL